MPAAVETMAYQGETPWHGLGERVEAGISTDKMLVKAGLDWKVAVAPMRFDLRLDGERIQGSAPDKALVRLDTKTVLDTVGPRYIPVQNSQVLDFFREYVEAGSMELETAGSLMGGQYIWALARMTGSFDLGSKAAPDKVFPYVLLVNPHLYGKALVTKFTTIRGVCLNTITMALMESAPEVRIWHVKEFNADLQAQAKINLGIAPERWEAFHKNAETLAATTIDTDVARKLATEILGGDPEKPSRKAQRVLDLFAGEGKGSQLPSAKDTAWGFLNAVTEYFDHHSGRIQDNRLQSAWMGYGSVRKQRVLDSLLRLAA